MEANAAASLDRIRIGAGHLVLTAQARMSEIKEALERGEFEQAHGACARMQTMLSRLAAAEQSLGKLADGHLIACKQVEPGMELLDLGVVSEIGPCPGCGQPACEHMSITFHDDSRMIVPREAEVVVNG